MSGALDRAHGALAGLAIGDALGMPTQLLSRHEVHRLFPVLAGFEAGPDANAVSRGISPATVTDDTRHALILADLLLEGGGHIDADLLAARLLEWSRRAAAEVDGEQLGPSTRRALEAIRKGVPVGQAGRSGDTNGAAMRIAPVGIAIPDETEALIAAVEEACRATHNTGIAMAGAAAVAGAVSAGIDGASVERALDRGTELAAIAGGCGHFAPGADVAARLRWARGLVRDEAEGTALDVVDRLIGTGVQTQESVPAAFALATIWRDEPWRACLGAAHLGGDADTIGAMVGAILGACHGVAAFPAHAVEEVEQVNGLALRAVGERLLDLRRAAVGDGPGLAPAGGGEGHERSI